MWNCLRLFKGRNIQFWPPHGQTDIRLEEQYFGVLAKGVIDTPGVDCIPEITLGMYLNDSLVNTEVLFIEEHLVECSPCRIRIIAIQRGICDANEEINNINVDDSSTIYSNPVLLLMMSKQFTIIAF